MHLRSCLIGLLLLLPLAWAETLVVYPLESQDVLLGVAVADRIAQAFAGGELEVTGPEVAPALVPPITTSEGFINLIDFLDRDEGETAVFDSATGARLLHELLGADNVLSGNVVMEEGMIRAQFFLATPEGTETFRLSAPEADPAQLVSKALAVLAARLQVARPDLELTLDLSSPYGDLVRALALVGLGLLDQAASVLEGAELSDIQAEPRIAELQADIEAVRIGEQGLRPERRATMSLGLSPLDEDVSRAYFEAFGAETELPVVATWLATLAASDNDLETADGAFDRAAELYPFGGVARAAYRASRLAEPGDLDDLLESERLSALLSAALAANLLGELELEKAALHRLTRVLPSYVYPFERLSFIAFDEDDALAAAEALVVAVRLQPESDLYWTNLGWSYYLLGLLNESEAASLRATELSESQYIAYYNLGLARVVTGRLDAAMDAYAQALALDPEVDDEAVHDLENALELYPNEGGVHYALGTLYEREGRRGEAAEQFDAYLATGPEVLLEQAQRRLEVLRAPLPPIEISPGASLGLGSGQLEAAPYRPGDRVYPSFELYTPGDELPQRVTVEVSLRSGEESLQSQSRDIDIPPNAIGYVIESFGLDLPGDLSPGDYTVQIEASASEDRTASASLELSVAGQPELLRQLLSRDIDMRSLESNSALYGESDLNRSDDVLVASLIEELRSSAAAAEEALPRVDSGRFEGLSGGELFRESSAQDVRDFLAFLLGQNTSDATFNFVDAYAQWALDGGSSGN